MSEEPEKVDCFKCRHFKVTYEPKAPRACLAYGFKGTELPSRTVLLESGEPCKLFELRNES